MKPIHPLVNQNLVNLFFDLQRGIKKIEKWISMKEALHMLVEVQDNPRTDDEKTLCRYTENYDLEDIQILEGVFSGHDLLEWLFKNGLYSDAALEIDWREELVHMLTMIPGPYNIRWQRAYTYKDKVHWIDDDLIFEDLIKINDLKLKDQKLAEELNKAFLRVHKLPEVLDIGDLEEPSSIRLTWTSPRGFTMKDIDKLRIYGYLAFYSEEISGDILPHLLCYSVINEDTVDYYAQFRIHYGS